MFSSEALIEEVRRLSAEPCAAQAQRRCRPGSRAVSAGGRPGRAAQRNATGCAGVRETPGVGAAPGPRAACLGFHWSRGGAGRAANMTLKILIEMKRCSEGAHSSVHSPAGLTARLRPRLWEMPSCSPAGSSGLWWAQAVRIQGIGFWSWLFSMHL